LEEAQATLEHLQEKELPRLSSWQEGYAAYLLTQIFEIDENAFIVLYKRLSINLGLLCQNLCDHYHFAAALETAKEIKDDEDRAGAMRDIAVAQSNAGLVDEACVTFAAALETAKEIKYDGYRAGAMRDIAVAQTNAGLVDEARVTFAAALETAKEIEDDWHRARAMGAIAVAQTNAGLVDEARITFAAALETAKEIEDDENRAEAMRDIAVAQINAGLSEQAIREAETILTDCNIHLPIIADVLAKSGDKKHFKQMLIPCAYYLDSACRMCGVLAWIYPEQAAEVAKKLSEL